MAPFQLGEMQICHYGHLSWITPLMAFFAMWMFLFPAFRCSLTISKPPGTEVEIFVGYWKRESTELAYANVGDDGNVCVGWNDKDFFDGIWKFGRGVGVLGSMTCPLTLLVDIAFIFIRMPLRYFYCPIFSMHVMNAILSILLLTGLASQTCANDYCKMSRGSYVAIIAAVFWLIIAYLIIMLRKIEMELPDEYPEEEEDDYPSGRKGRGAPQYEEEEEEPDVEKPLALPAPPTQRKKKKQQDEPERLALPPSENSQRRQQQQPSSPKKKKGSRNNDAADGDEETPLALPMSENASGPKKSKKKKKAATAESGGGDGTAAPKSRKKKTKKPADA